jgi:hypothetical protein
VARDATPARVGRASRWSALDRIDQAGLPAAHRALLREVEERLGAQRPMRRGTRS